MPAPPKFAIGDAVIFINDYGVNWGRKTVTAHTFDEVRGNVYAYVPTDTPWFMTGERHLFGILETDAIAAATVVDASGSRLP